MDIAFSIYSMFIWLHDIPEKLFQEPVMKKMIICLVACICFTVPAKAADICDIIVVVDQSGSIYHNMPVIKEYIKKSIFGKIAKKDDYIYIFSFDGNFNYSGLIRGNEPPEKIDPILNKIQPYGQHTDLTNAVEKMTHTIQEKIKTGSRKVVFFLTDGVNDPPRDSPYREGLQHRFFQESKKSVAGGGWAVYVTSIGQKTDGAKVAGLVGAEYVELSERPTLSEFDAKLTSKLRQAREGSKWYLWVLGGLFIAGVGAGGFLYFRR